MLFTEFVTESKIMSRGGKRKGAGAKPGWNHGKTKTIRVPIALADEILANARKLDDNGLLENVTESNSCPIVDISGIPIKAVSGEMGIMLSSLVKKGYRLVPDRVDDVVRRSIDNKVKYG